MNQRAQIIRDIQSAPSLRAQAAHVAALEMYDRTVTAKAAEDRAWDASSAIVEQTLRPMQTLASASTGQSDWLDDFESTEDYAAPISAEAASWFGRTTPDLRADREEFTAQASGYLRRQASQYGAHAQAAFDHGMQYVSFLHRQAASGLPQVQQLVDSQENPAQTPQPDDVFDNFAPPIHPINGPMFGTETSERAPLIQEIMQQGGGDAGAPTHHDTAQQFAGPAPQEATPGTYNAASGDQGPNTVRASYQPTVAINHTATLDDFRREAALQAEGSKQCANCNSQMSYKIAGNASGWVHEHNGEEGCDDGSGMKATAGLKYHVYRQDIDGRGVQHNKEPFDTKAEAEAWMKDSRSSEGQGGRVHYLVSEDENGQRLPYPQASRQVEGRSTLDQIEQVVDSAENPKPTPLPLEVAFPWQIDEHDQNIDERSDKKASFDAEAYQRRAAYVAGLAARDPRTLTPNERHEVLAFTASLQRTADQWSQSGPQSHGPEAGNNPSTTPNPAAGRAEGVQDKREGDAPTFADASSAVPPNVQQYSQGYSQAETQAGATPGQMPPGAGGMQQGYQTHTGSLQRISSRFVSAEDASDKDFARGYKFASRWESGKRLVRQGSAAFEAGLYAAITDAPNKVQRDWVAAHMRLAKREQGFGKRISLHASFSRENARALGMRVQGAYLQPMSKTAATTTDLDTMDGRGSPSPQGQTPINGPGTPPPLAGGTDPARPGGIPPYQGGTPVAPHHPSQNVTKGTPTAIDTRPGAPVDQAAIQHLGPQALAFRRTVQANLLKGN